MHLKHFFCGFWSNIWIGPLSFEEKKVKFFCSPKSFVANNFFSMLYQFHKESDSNLDQLKPVFRVKPSLYWWLVGTRWPSD